MKTSTANRLLLAASVLAFSAGAGHAQNLSTSTGAFGPLTLADNETRVINLPADGRINATTITLGEGAKLSFVRNFANTPVYLLATGAVSINGQSTSAVTIPPIPQPPAWVAPAATMTLLPE